MECAYLDERIVNSRLFIIWERTTLWLLNAIVYAGVLRGLVLMPIQSIYLKRLQKLDDAQQLSAKELRILNEELNELQYLGSWLGNNMRDMGSIGLLLYGFQTMMPLTVPAFNYITRSSWDMLKQSGLMLYLSNPDRSKRRISREIDALADYIASSRVQYVQSQHAASGQCDMCEAHRIYEDVHDDNVFASDFADTDIRARLAFRRCATWLHLRRQLDDCVQDGLNASRARHIERQILLPNEHNNVSRRRIQQAELVARAALKKRAWPINRRDVEWRMRIIKLWHQLHCFSISIVMIFVHIISIVIHISAYENSKRTPAMSVSDRFGMVIQSLFVYYSIIHGIAPLMLTGVGIVDSNYALDDLRTEMMTLLRVRARNAHLNDNLACVDIDKQALEIYIRYRLFIKDLRMTLKYNELMMTRVALLILAGVVIMVSAVPRASTTAQRGLSIVIATLIWIVLTASLTCVAAFSSKCLKTSKIIWTILSQDSATPSDDDPDRKYVSAMLSSNSPVIIDVSDTERAQQAKGCKCAPPPLPPPLTSHTLSRITPHTMNLWRRLVADHRRLEDAFTSKLFSKFPIDFRGIVRLNFWTLSTLIIYWAGRAQTHATIAE